MVSDRIRQGLFLFNVEFALLFVKKARDQVLSQFKLKPVLVKVIDEQSVESWLKAGLRYRPFIVQVFRDLIWDIEAHQVLLVRLDE